MWKDLTGRFIPKTDHFYFCLFEFLQNGLIYCPVTTLLNVFFCMHVSWVVGVFSLEQTEVLSSCIQEEEGQG